MPIAHVGDQTSTNRHRQEVGRGIGSVGVAGVADHERRVAPDCSKVPRASGRVGPPGTADEIVGHRFRPAKGKTRRGVDPLSWTLHSGEDPRGRSPQWVVRISIPRSSDAKLVSWSVEVTDHNARSPQIWVYPIRP